MPPVIAIRRINEEERAELRGAVQRYWLQLMPHAPVVSNLALGDQVFAERFQLDRSGHHYWWAIADGTRVGFAVVELEEGFEGLGAQIADFSIECAYQRRGYGRAFITALIAWLTRQGVYRIDLNVRQDNPGALAFWRNAGFEGALHVVRQYLALPVPGSRGSGAVPARTATLAQRPDLAAQVPDLHTEAWPLFLRQDAVAARYWSALFSDFPDYQVVLHDGAERVLAVAHSVPLVWDGTTGGLPAGWDAALEQGIQDQRHRRRPTTLCALSIVVARDQQGQGLSPTALWALRDAATHYGLSALIAPVRPTLKSSYPLTPMERYIRWQRDDGSLFDPWLRVHRRLGAELLAVTPRSMVVEGTVADWQQWTGLRFPESGPYVVPGALQPVLIDRAAGQGRYEDPNVWMLHRLARDSSAPAARGAEHHAT